VSTKPFSQDVPACKKPLAGYLRLTEDREGRKIGYEVQKEAIERWAAYAGRTVGRWYQDRDITAADKNVRRDQYEEMLADVEAGTWGGVVVWRLDRLVRLTYEFERCYRIMENTGGIIVSIDPSVISSEDELGRVFMRLLVIFAEMEINAMRARARGHRRALAKAGKANGGGPRAFGFAGAVKDEDGKYLNVGHVGIDHVPDEIEHMREAARRIAWEGWEWTDVITDWNDRGIAGTTGKPVSVTTLITMLTSLRAAGKREYELEDEETGEVTRAVRDAQWEPVLDMATWERLQTLRKKLGPRGPRRQYLMSGEALCGRCDHPLEGKRIQVTRGGQRVERFNYYCDSDVDSKARGHCGKLNIMVEPVDEMVKAFILRRFEVTPSLVTSLNELSTESHTELNAATEEIEKLKARKTDLAQRFAAGTLDADDWEAAREPIVLAIDHQRAVIRRITSRLAVPVPGDDDWTNLSDWWDGLVLNQRKILTRVLVDCTILPLQSGPRFNPARVILEPRPVKHGVA